MGGKVQIWGILNVTPDSFSDGFPGASADDFVAKGLRLADDGADVIDVGGESTRPGAKAISVSEELDRVIPVIEALRKNCSSKISIDTTKAEVAEAALGAGASIVNDINGMRDDGGAMASAAAKFCARVVAMHRRKCFDATDIIPDIKALWGESLGAAKAASLASEFVILDPGFGVGFCKAPEQNLSMLKRLGELREAFPGNEILIGLSRKSFLGAFGDEGDPASRDHLSAAAAMWAAAIGAVDHVRVHDVKLSKRLVAFGEAIRGAR
ncbi:MAG: dihydropteroate synthase [Puniceicoccales bacterium]|jgi:dihydropteroate synthase|nr:dihydropteroate synthase [Puniceicoccales bacterium]